MALMLSFLTKYMPEGLARVLMIALAVWAVFTSVFLFGKYEYHLGKVETTKIYERKLAAFRDEYEAARSQEQAAHTHLLGEQNKLVVELSSQLAEASKHRQEVREVIKEVPKYVTAKADAQCVVTRGFVRLHNLPLAPEIAGVPQGTGGDVDASTTIKASEIAATVAENYGECVQRGELISMWQEWYKQSRKTWEEYRNAQVKEVLLPK